MKTIVKIDPDKEYSSAKKVIESFASRSDLAENLSILDSSVDNLKTVINVLLERATPKKRRKPPKNNKKKKAENSLRKDFEKLPSEKFPDLEVKEKVIV